MRRYRFVIGAVVITAGLAYLLISSFRQSAAAHMSLASLLDEVTAGRPSRSRIQLGGNTVVPGSIEWDEYRSRPRFTITDGQRLLRVRYMGNAVLPDTFQDRANVVLEGQYSVTDSVFEAQVVYAKCPSKYEGQSYEEHRQAVGG